MDQNGPKRIKTDQNGQKPKNGSNGQGKGPTLTRSGSKMDKKVPKLIQLGPKIDQKRKMLVLQLKTT